MLKCVRIVMIRVHSLIGCSIFHEDKSGRRSIRRKRLALHFTEEWEKGPLCRTPVAQGLSRRSRAEKNAMGMTVLRITMHLAVVEALLITHLNSCRVYFNPFTTFATHGVLTQ